MADRGARSAGILRLIFFIKIPIGILGVILDVVCQESMQGIEHAHRLTFFFSIGALIAESFLPG